MDSNSEEKIPSSVQPLHHHDGRHNHNHSRGRHHYHSHGRHHHHHHFFYISPHCPLHNSILQPKNHSPSCSFSTSYPSHQNIASIPTEPHLRFRDTQPNEAFEEFPLVDQFAAIFCQSCVYLHWFRNFSFLLFQIFSSCALIYRMIENGIEKLNLEEDEEEEEPTFVLTDEWREFFAKSEAKRRLAKKQGKKRRNQK